MTDTGQVVFISRDGTLDPPDLSRYDSVHLATIRPTQPGRSREQASLKHAVALSRS